MAAPIDSKITLPSDTGNSGKNVRTQTRVVGSNTVHEHYFIPTVGMEVIGKYFYASTTQTIATAAHDGTTTGFLWFQLPTSATVTSIVRFISATAAPTDATAFATSPVIRFSKFTFTGTASGTTTGGTPYKTAGVSRQTEARNAMTGMTITLAGIVGNFIVPIVMTGVGSAYGHSIVKPYNPLAYMRGVDLEFGPGEGLVVWQASVGSAADTRKFLVQVEWDEIDLT